MKTDPKTNGRFDGVIYHIETRKIISIAGRDLREDGGFHTVSRRLETVSARLNDDYDVVDVEAGKFKVGDLIPE